MERELDHLTGTARPLWRGWIHAGSAVAAVPAGVALLVGADASDRVAAGVYVACLVAVLSVSAAYHLLARTANGQRVMQRIDRAAIFALIAGTYTPVTLAVLPAPLSAVVVTAVWLVAAAGAALRASGRAPRFCGALYVALGWVALSFVVPMAGRSLVVLALVAGGGVLYTTGAVLFALHRPRLLPTRFGFHEAWHGFTVAAAATHFAAVAILVTA